VDSREKELKVDSSKVKGEGRELNAETLSEQREEKQGEVESDWLNREESIRQGSMDSYYCQ